MKRASHIAGKRKRRRTYLNDVVKTDKIDSYQNDFLETERVSLFLFLF